MRAFRVQGNWIADCWAVLWKRESHKFSSAPCRLRCENNDNWQIDLEIRTREEMRDEISKLKLKKNYVFFQVWLFYWKINRCTSFKTSRVQISTMQAQLPLHMGVWLESSASEMRGHCAHYCEHYCLKIQRIKFVNKQFMEAHTVHFYYLNWLLFQHRYIGPLI